MSVSVSSKSKPWDRAVVCPNLAPPSHRIISEVHICGYGSIPVIKGDFKVLPEKVQTFVSLKAKTMMPKYIYICDGSSYEYDELLNCLKCLEYFQKLTSDDKTKEIDADDSKKAAANTFFTTKTRPRSRSEDARSSSRSSSPATLTSDKCLSPQDNDRLRGLAEDLPMPSSRMKASHKWISVYRLQQAVRDRFTACMRGRVLYVVPISIGPIGSYFLKNAVQLTDNPHAVIHLHTNARVSYAIWDVICSSNFVKGIHSVGLPRPVTVKLNADRPQNVKKVFIGQYVDNGEVWSFGTTLANIKLVEEMMADYYPPASLV